MMVTDYSIGVEGAATLAAVLPAYSCVGAEGAAALAAVLPGTRITGLNLCGFIGAEGAVAKL